MDKTCWSTNHVAFAVRVLVIDLKNNCSRSKRLFRWVHSLPVLDKPFKFFQSLLCPDYDRQTECMFCRVMVILEHVKRTLLNESCQGMNEQSCIVLSSHFTAIPSRIALTYVAAHSTTCRFLDVTSFFSANILMRLLPAVSCCLQLCKALVPPQARPIF